MPICLLYYVHSVICSIQIRSTKLQLLLYIFLKLYYIYNKFLYIIFLFIIIFDKLYKSHFTVYIKIHYKFGRNRQKLMRFYLRLQKNCPRQETILFWKPKKNVLKKLIQESANNSCAMVDASESLLVNENECSGAMGVRHFEGRRRNCTSLT